MATDLKLLPYLGLNAFTSQASALLEYVVNLHIALRLYQKPGYESLRDTANERLAALVKGRALTPDAMLPYPDGYFLAPLTKPEQVPYQPVTLDPRGLLRATDFVVLDEEGNPVRQAATPTFNLGSTAPYGIGMDDVLKEAALALDFFIDRAAKIAPRCNPTNDQFLDLSRRLSKRKARIVKATLFDNLSPAERNEFDVADAAMNTARLFRQYVTAHPMKPIMPDRKTLLRMQRDLFETNKNMDALFAETKKTPPACKSIDISGLNDFDVLGRAIEALKYLREFPPRAEGSQFPNAECCYDLSYALTQRWGKVKAFINGNPDLAFNVHGLDSNNVANSLDVGKVSKRAAFWFNNAADPDPNDRVYRVDKVMVDDLIECLTVTRNNLLTHFPSMKKDQ